MYYVAWFLEKYRSDFDTVFGNWSGDIRRILWMGSFISKAPRLRAGVGYLTGGRVLRLFFTDGFSRYLEK